MSTAILSLSMRPKGLSQMVGQKTLVEALRKQMETRPPQAFLLTGNSGTGKTTLARIIALSLQCDHQKLWGEPCEVCQGKEPGLASGIWSTFSVHEVNASSERGVEDLAKIVELSRYRPMAGNRRVIILDEAQGLSASAARLLLKPFEDPTPTTTWILATTEQQKLVVTLRRRCVQYQLKGLGTKGTEVLLQLAAKNAGIKLPLEPLIAQLEQQQITSSALILMSFEKYASGFSAEDSVTSTEGTSANTYAICKAMSGGRTQELRKLLQQVTAEESRWVRASTLGWLRGMFWRETQPKRLVVISDSMQELSDGRAPLDDALLLPWVIAAVYKVARRFAMEPK